MNAPYLAAVGRWLGGWPVSYLSIDIETNGINVNDPRVLPVEVGWCLVEDGQVVLNDGVTLDWFVELDGADAEDFAARLAVTHESMTSNGARYPFTPRFLEQNGVPPREGMVIVASKIAEAVAGGGILAGHNFMAFDRPILERAARDWAGIPLAIPAACVIDTMCIERATQKRQVPAPTGTRDNWYKRLLRGPERCSLQGHCATKYGFSVDQQRAHGAAYDAYLVHLLVERMRLAGGTYTDAAAPH